MHIAHQEYATAQIVEQPFQRGAVHPLPRGGAGEAFDHAHFVAGGLQTANQPSARVGKSAVIQIHWILRAQHNAQSERARLFEQRQHRGFGWRICARREIAKDFIHVEQRAQRRCAGLPARPGQHFIQQHRDKEHAFGIVEMRNGQNGHARFAFRRIEQALNIERLALRPGGKSGRGNQVVQPHGEREAVFGGPGS